MNNEWKFLLCFLVLFWTAFIGLLFNTTLPSNEEKLDNIVRELNENVR